MKPAYIVLDYCTNAVLCEALDRKSANLSAEWYRAQGRACVVRAA